MPNARIRLSRNHNYWDRQNVAIDQVFTFNRFGAFNPLGMIYALEGDVVGMNSAPPGPGNAQLRPDKRPRPLVLLCDVSGSMERYSRMLLHFAHAIMSQHARVEAFLFSTELSHVTRQLRRPRAEELLPLVRAALVHGEGAPALLANNTIDPAPYLLGGEVAPPATERGWKDTVGAHPNQVTRIRQRFDLPAGLSTPQKYAYHCHILEHEDNDMMRPYEVV